MAIALLQNWLPLSRQQRAASPRSEAVTLEDIEASTGKGPAADLSDSTFHAGTEEFMSAVTTQVRDTPARCVGM